MRSPAFVFLLISVLSANSLRAQSDELIVQGQTGKLYLTHTVVAKENWYSIGRLYNTNPRALAPFNNLTMDKPLDVGQQLEIPLTAANFAQTRQKAATETLVPVYHIVQEKEWLYRISLNHNKVPIGSLEKWNNITKDGVTPGMRLVVGFLKVKTASSALATSPPAPSTTAGSITSPAKTSPIATGPASTTTANIAPSTTPARQTMSTTPSTFSSEHKTSDSSAATTRQKTVTKNTTAPVVTETTRPDPNADAAKKTFNGGYFRTDYTESGKTVSGLAGTFKSTSGWQDGKYYALMNNVTVGTVVRVTLPSTNKTVYVKILGQLPDMKESAGLTIRISNAAAGELGAGDGRFNADIKY